MRAFTHRAGFGEQSGRLRRLGVLLLVAVVSQLPGYLFADAPGRGGGPASMGLPPGEFPVKLGNLLVTTYPQGAEIRVNSEVFGTTPLDPLNVEAGWYLVQALKPNLFASARVHVRVGNLTTVALTLNNAKGTLSVLSRPDRASVFLDGERRGETPLRLEGISAGDHDLRVSRRGYLDYSTGIDIGASEESVVDVHLPVPAKLDLRSEPEGADIYIGNRHVGRTPTLAQSVRPGPLEITIRLDNFDEWIESIEVAEDESRLLIAELVARRFPLNLVSDPPGAEIEMDGAKIGTTPLHWAVPLGERRFVFRRPGYEDNILRVYVSSDMEPDLHVALRPVTGFVTLRNAPAGATVALLDSESRVWPSPLEGVEVTAGAKRFLVRAPGYRTREIRAEVRYEEELVLRPEWQAKSSTGGLLRVLIPGLSQRYQEKRVRSVLIPAAQAAALAGLLITTNSYNDAVDSYNTAWDRYMDEVVAEPIDAAWREAQDRHDRMEDKKTVRNVFLAASVGIYLYNLVDALFLVPDYGETSSSGVDFTANPAARQLSMRLRLVF